MPNRGKGNLPQGRPPKFDEPSRPITVTLPERTLEQLASLGPDRAKSIVAAVEHLVGGGSAETPWDEPQLDVIDMAPGVGVLVLPWNGLLAGIPWLRLIAIGRGRYLLTVPSGTPIEKLEVVLMDLIAQARMGGGAEVELLEELRELIGDFRRGECLSKAEILVVEKQPDWPAGPSRFPAEELHQNPAGV
jgi:hypothetical protein